jgi:hypothetical protein
MITRRHAIKTLALAAGGLAAAASKGADSKSMARWLRPNIFRKPRPHQVHQLSDIHHAGVWSCRYRHGRGTLPSLCCK